MAKTATNRSMNVDLDPIDRLERYLGWFGKYLKNSNN